MKESTFTYIGGTIIVILLLTTIIGTVSNSRNKRSLNEEKAQNESLAAQKLQVSQELDKIKSDLADLNTKKESTDKALTDTEAKLRENEKKISSLAKENGSLLKNRNELEALQKSNGDLQKAYEDLKLEHESSLSKIKELENTAILMTTDNKNLTSSLAKSETYRTDNIEIYGSRGNKKDKLTICASRTKKLNLNFDVPQSLTEAIKFKIITPDNKTITPENKTLTMTFPLNTNKLTASLSAVTGEFELARHVNLTYTSNEKLVPGEYKIEIFSNDTNIGNCRVKLK